MAASTKRQAREQARSAVNKWAAGLAATAWIPGSHYVMVAGDIVFVQQVGSIFGVSIDETTAGQIFATVAAPLVGSKVAHSILDFIPVAGWIVKSVIAGGVTKAVGEALIGYFNDCSRLPEG